MLNANDAGPMRYAVVGCQCGNTWALELRHATATCTQCRQTVDVKRRRRLWQGNDLREAQAAAGSLRAARAQGLPETQAAAAALALQPEKPLVRHDTPVDAAAAKAKSITNKSARAEAVALWLTRLLDRPDEATMLESMRRAGIEAVRAEKEIVRMLACDILYEPAIGRYAMLDA